ncbi:forkhead box protein J1-like [Nyctibius grandis]|uniref:forkhead box protein J1-like n=1 Tax=Nyctibius grandis TaxID=48427 RepID=UPI0035BBECD3
MKDELDDSLSSLMWLSDFSVANIGMAKPSWCPSGPDPHDRHRIPSFPALCSPLATNPACMGLPHTPCNPISSSTSRTLHHATAMHPQLAGDIDYKTNPHVKPPYSYASLISMAMEASNEPKITLSAIYKWVTDNFCYFRHANPTWQNSIRRSLCLNKRFIRVPREKGEPGKGSFWKLDRQYADRLKNGGFKKRRTPSVKIHPAATEKAQQEAQSIASPPASVYTSNNIHNINMNSQQLLEEFEEATSGRNRNPVGGKAEQKRKQPLPKGMEKVPRLSDSALLTEEEERELQLLIGDFDWEALFNTSRQGDFSTCGDPELTSPTSSTTHGLDLTVQGHHINGPRERDQEQVLTQSSENNTDFETLMATSFLQHPWDKETTDYLLSPVNVEQVFELNDTSLPADVSDWSSLASLL